MNTVTARTQVRKSLLAFDLGAARHDCGRRHRAFACGRTRGSGIRRAGEEHRACPRRFRRWFELGEGHYDSASQGLQRHRGADSTDRDLPMTSLQRTAP